MRKLLNETALVFAYQLRVQMRQPVWSLIMLFQPLLYLCLFGPLLERLGGAVGRVPGDSWRTFVPGLMVQLGIFSCMWVGFGLVSDLREGVIERWRVTPACRSALLLGRVCRDAVVLLLQCVFLVLAAVPMGFRSPFLGVVATLAMVLPLGIALSSISYTAALRLKTEDGLAHLLNLVSVPALLLSGILLPMTLAPRWLYVLSRLNPFSYVVEGARAAFRGEFLSPSFIGGSVSAVVLAAVSIVWATHAYRRESA